MSNLTPGDGIRDISIKDSGDDDNSGANILRQVKSPSVAAGRASALVPEPSLFAPAAIVDSGASRYALSAPYVIPDNVQSALPFSSFAASFSGWVGDAVIKASENSQCTALTLSTNSDDGLTAYSTNGKSRTAFDSRAVIMNGPNQTGVSLDGVTDQAFLSLGQVLARFSGSTGISVTSTGASPRYYQINEVNMSGDNCVGVKYDTAAAGAAVYRIGAVTYEEDVTNPDTGAGCVGIEVTNGTLVGYAAEIIVETAFETGVNGDLVNDSLLTEGVIINKGKMNISSRRHTGDIINDPGAVMTVRIDEHVSGNVANLGILNGEINGIRYGSWAVDDINQQVRTGIYDGGIGSFTPDVVARFTLDTNTDMFDVAQDYLKYQYEQSTGLSRTVTFRMVNADNGDVYYESVNTDTGGGPNPTKTFYGDIALDKVLPIPGLSVINMQITAQRSFGGGLSTPSTEIAFTRTP